MKKKGGGPSTLQGISTKYDKATPGLRNELSLFLLLILNSFSALHAATCGDASVSLNVTPPNFQVQVVNLPPQFTDMRVECNTNANALCATSLNVTDSTVVMDITTPGQYTNLNDYNFLRANRSIFPTFDNDFIITPTDVATLNFGVAIAISGDGSTLAIGAAKPAFATLNPAYVNIYRRKGAAWLFVQRIDKPVFEAYGFGGTIALSYDGSVLAVGAPDDQVNSLNFPTVGCIALYDYSQITNTYSLTQLIRGATESGFGFAVALSATGQYLVFTETSQSSPNTIIPATYVYARSRSCETTCNNQNTWQLQSYLTCRENNGSIVKEFNRSFSKIIAVSADGSTIAFGSPFRVDLSGIITGAVGVFKRTGSAWRQTQFITSPNPTPNLDGFGSSVALSGDGKYLAVGQVRNSNGTTGSVYIYEQRGSSYGLSFSFSSVNLFSFNAAGGVAFSEDGTVLVIGGGDNPNAGSVAGSVFIALRGPDNRWSVPFSLVGQASSNLGFAVDCSADGAFVIAGEPGTGSTTGRAHVFRPVGSFIPNDTVITGSLCVYNRTTIDAALKVAGNVHLNGTIVTGTAGRVTACSAILSDHRMKDSISSLSAQEALDKLRDLQPKTFSWINKQHESSVGFIADEMKNAFPNFVGERPALDDEVQFIHDGKTKTIIIRAELYAYLITALERLVEKNEQRKKEIGVLTK